MAIRFDCPNCKANYEVADELAGKMIMCRVCKKRGPVRSLTASAITATLPSAAGVMAASPSRRNFLPYAALFAASLGAIGVGALLARQPWERGSERRPDDGPGGRRRRGPPGEDKKDDKEGATPPQPKL